MEEIEVFEEGVMNYNDITNQHKLSSEFGIPVSSVISELRRSQIAYRYVRGVYLFPKTTFLNWFFNSDNLRCCGQTTE